MIFRLLNWQGMIGIAAALALSVLLLVQKAETAHWKKQSASFEQLYRQEEAAFSTTVADYRAAAAQAHAADEANLNRVAAEQAAINQRTVNDYQSRLAAARADAARLSSGRLRRITQAAADSRARGNPPLPSLSASAGRAAQAAGEDGLSSDDALTATEQAIQLDELIKWIKAQTQVIPNQEK